MFGYRVLELVVFKKLLLFFKLDVYVFGVILLELLIGRCVGEVVFGEGGGVDLIDWVRLRVVEGRGIDCFDFVLIVEMVNVIIVKGIKEVFGIVLRCIRFVFERLGIKIIYEDLLFI